MLYNNAIQVLYQMHFHNAFKERDDTAFVIQKCHSQN